MLFVNRGRFVWKSYTLAKLSLLQYCIVYLLTALRERTNSYGIQNHIFQIKVNIINTYYQCNIG